MKLDNNQQYAYDLCASGVNVYVMGIAGAGKTYIVKHYISNCRQNGKNVVVCAFTKKAALNMDSDNGETIYSAFNTYPGGITASSEKADERLKRSVAYDADVIIVDEISMVSASLFTYICSSIRKITIKTRRHIQLIVLGDFLQLPPICKKGQEPEYAFESKWWSLCDFKCAILEESHRQMDAMFSDYLSYIREGIHTKECIKYLTERAKYLQMRTDAVTLCSYLEDVKEKNIEKINSLPGKAICYHAKTSANIKIEDMGVWNDLVLKIGTFVMTTYNDPHNRYYNGALGYVVAMTDNTITVRFIDSKKEKQHVVIIERHKWVNNNTYVEQFPIIPAYAITIHKAQGCTLDYVNINPKCFADGQLYVALSRVRSVEHLYITNEIHEDDIRVNEKALNFYRRLYASVKPYRREKSLIA